MKQPEEWYKRVSDSRLYRITMVCIFEEPEFREVLPWELPLLSFDGSILIVSPGFRYDGPSGPMRDTPNSMRAALLHDCLYRAARAGFIPMSFRRVADKIFRRHLLEDGVFLVRAWYAWAAVRMFGRRAWTRCQFE